MRGWLKRYVWLHVWLLGGVVAACSGDATGPGERDHALSVHSGAEQYALIGDIAAEPLAVVVTDRRTGDPVPGVAVRWRVVHGAGASLLQATSTSDTEGVARTRLQVGSETGRYEVSASLESGAGEPVHFDAWAVHRPAVTALHPSRPVAGDTVWIEGEHLSIGPRLPAVTFGGLDAEVVAADATSLRVVAPRCLPTRTVELEVRLGAIWSDAHPVGVDGVPGESIDLEVGEVELLASPTALECLRLPGGSNVGYLLVLHNTTAVPAADLPFRLAVLSTAARDESTSWPTSLADADVPPAEAWEHRIRSLERELPSPALAEAGAPRLHTLSTPAPGSRRDFQVYNKDGEFTRVSAEVRHVSEHAVFYVDERAPAGGLTDGDLKHFGHLFDDPIHTTLVPVFGEPSDIDGNGRVIVLFTPVVNELTPRGTGSSGFVAGYFYGCDLHTRQTCAHSNEAEVFYSLVPDPKGEHGDVRTRDDLLTAVPPVLAHEFQHMIHYNERVRVRGGTQEVLWLSEALAHMAEDRVHDALRERGEHVLAQPFLDSNRARAIRFLQHTTTVSLVADESPGTLTERGAQWLFLKYLAGHYGGDDLLRRLTQTAMGSIRNVEDRTGREWDELLAEWSVALWADVAMRRRGVPLDPVYTYRNLDLRATLSVAGSYPLSPMSLIYQDYLLSGTLLASGSAYLLLSTTLSGAPPVHLSLMGGADGAPSGLARPRISVMRVQ